MNIHSARTAFGLRSWKTILGITVASVGRDEAIGLLNRMLVERHFTRVGFLNSAKANLACREPALAAALDGFLVLPDGVWIDVAARLLHGSAFPSNLAGTDFVPAFLESVQQPLRVGLLAARRANASARALAAMAPRHDYLVFHDGSFASGDEAAILDRLAAERPDILLVAVGVPRQELWISGNLTADHCTLAIAVDELLDLLGGAVPHAPAMLRRLRLAWLYRLCLEPGRPWRRHVLGSPAFLLRVLHQKATGRGEAS